ncbi:unnamed protein product, partial [Brassica rapa subsp. trilocularis]
MTPKKKKKSRNLLKGSSKMARLQGASKPAGNPRKLAKASPLASASCADAVIAASAVMMSDTPPSVSAVNSEVSVDLQSSPSPTVEKSITLTADEEKSTSAVVG